MALNPALNPQAAHGLQPLCFMRGWGDQMDHGHFSYSSTANCEENSGRRKHCYLQGITPANIPWLTADLSPGSQGRSHGVEADTPTISAHLNWLNPSLGTSQALLICCLTHRSSSQLRSIRFIRAFMGQLKAQLVLLHTLGQAGAAYPRLKHPGGLSPSSCPATPALLVAA